MNYHMNMPLSFFTKKDGLQLGKPGTGFKVPIKMLDPKTAPIEDLAYQIGCILPKEKPFRTKVIRTCY